MTNREVAINRVLNEEDVNIDELLGIMEDGGMIFDYLDMPYTDGTYKTDEQKRENIIEDFMNYVMDVQEFNSEYSDCYETRWDYIYHGAFGRDYFDNWYRFVSDIECIEDIEWACKRINAMVNIWECAVENGWIDPEDGWEE